MISINTTVILGVIALAIVIMTFYGSTSTVKEGLDSKWLSFTKTENAAISGHNNKTLKNMSVSDCETACKAESWCKSFDYNKPSKYCLLSDDNAADVGGLKTTYSGNPYDYYEGSASPPPKPAPQCSSFTCPTGTSSLSSSGCLKTPNAVIPSGGLKLIDTSVTDCVAALKKDSRWKAINYNKAGGYCNLISATQGARKSSSWDFYNCADDTKTCTGGNCDPTQCCEPNPTCNTLSSCPAGRQFKAGKNSITCAGATCVSTECCEAIPKPKCTSFTCAKHSTKRSGAADITCKTYNCTEEECCKPDPKPNCGQQDVSCPTNFHGLSNPGATECRDYTCNTKDCCAPNPQCASHTCWAGTTGKSRSQICKGATCTNSECCSDNPKCGSYKCPSNTDSANTPTKTCSGPQCKPSDCCIMKATCKSFGTCDALHTSAPASTVCTGTECTSAECCLPNPTCGPYTCGTGYTKKQNISNKICAELPCEKNECCNANPTCRGWTCPKGDTRKLLSDEYTCKTSKCTKDECCGANPTCNTHTCSSSFYSLGSLLPNASGITCGGPECTDAECCKSTPSWRMPKVDVWPLLGK